MKGLSVTLPEGVALNPAAADGLQACSQEEIGLQSPAPPSCPEAAKVATVKIKTPLLPNPLEGAAYLATQDANPFGSLVALYVYAEDPVSGVRAKAAGEVLENPVTGQLTAHFEGDPVFEDDPRYADEPEAQFLPGGALRRRRTALLRRRPRTARHARRRAAPTRRRARSRRGRGTATTESSSKFEVVSGPNGSPCAAPLPFSADR